MEEQRGFFRFSIVSIFPFHFLCLLTLAREFRVQLVPLAEFRPRTYYRKIDTLLCPIRRSLIYGSTTHRQKVWNRISTNIPIFPSFSTDEIEFFGLWPSQIYLLFRCRLR